ncbi:gluconate 2-dehydrogenase subunit 3 family protein [Brevibacillus dissolubilis]|uniref:gluconate 2-dehydrogenase subunit 3 family protein n=1 Tax=Brevibacillus dissolubilis TaxID=1844116 RepID=UPI001C3F3E78|nr:gluconate 2-dehydrogenase subunit 3 family protein [Brevibacillus dissolubilis]
MSILILEQAKKSDLIIERDNFDQYVLNHCAKYLARKEGEPRHNYNGELADSDPRAKIADQWRFPIIDSYGDGSGNPACYDYNLVTFVYAADDAETEHRISVVGTFANLYERLPLQQIRFAGEATRYYALSVKVPKGQVHTYKFCVDGEWQLDPINPQTAKLDNGVTWSRFFTQSCAVPLTFERWERVILERLTDHILPFHTEEGERFLKNYYYYLDRDSKEQNYTPVYRLDEQVGVVNYIDKVLAREERHHLIDYKICLAIIDQLLRQRRRGLEPDRQSREVYMDLYRQMACNDVVGWDYHQYGNPRYFLQLVRRHTITGAFSHPKYGGNISGAGWAFLGELFCDDKGKTLFDWRRSIEYPLGLNEEYNG